MFDHEIPLNQESRITIIHGPNGVGKTVLMRMVSWLVSLLRLCVYWQNSIRHSLQLNMDTMTARLLTVAIQLVNDKENHR